MCLVEQWYAGTALKKASIHLGNYKNKGKNNRRHRKRSDPKGEKRFGERVKIGKLFEPVTQNILFMAIATIILGQERGRGKRSGEVPEAAVCLTITERSFLIRRRGGCIVWEEHIMCLALVIKGER